MGVIAGVLVGYIGWLVAISIGAAITTVSRWSITVLVASVMLAFCAAAWGWRLRRRRSYLWAGFAFGVPMLPVLLTLGVLCATYL
jgi:hypothetical protein